MAKPDWKWQDDAQCRGEDLILFFGPDAERQPERDVRERKAKALCAQCPVRNECLNYALDRPEKYGTWGGRNPDERETDRRRISRRASYHRAKPEPEQPVTEKRCTRCYMVKPLSAFRNDKSHRDGLHSACKTCSNGAQRRRRARAA
ncbi:WhiB family transcriptional regulator [Nonomuraea sp. NPDC000554]|uniref:WhiB family transcriptional regulator n=1 Tax=Nonomuraea sp. NPDC000554 TaxID=3154259 RepID=UPI00332E8B2C